MSAYRREPVIGVARFAITSVVSLIYPVLLAVAVIVPAPEAVTLIVALPSAPVTPLPVATPEQGH